MIHEQVKIEVSTKKYKHIYKSNYAIYINNKQQLITEGHFTNYYWENDLFMETRVWMITCVHNTKPCGIN